MIVSQIALSLAFLTGQAAGQADVKFPGIPQEQTSLIKLTDWHGWTYAAEGKTVWPRPYDAGLDWSDVQKHVASKGGTQAIWHLKVVVFTKTEADGRDSRGILRQKRATIESSQLLQIRESVARLEALVAAQTDGAIKVVTDLQIENEWMRESGTSPFGVDFAARYFEARINGGTYESEDKIFRGPFHSAIYVLPGSLFAALPDAVVNDTPVSGISSRPIAADGSSLDFDSALDALWIRQVGLRAREKGYQGIAISTDGPVDSNWTVAADLAEPSGASYVANLNKTLALHASITQPHIVKLPSTPTTSVDAAADNEKGQVLKVVEASAVRDGGIALPIKADGTPLAKADATPTLTFSAKSSNKDPMSVRLDSSTGKSAWISLGPDPFLVNPAAGLTVLSVPFTPNGKWQKISVDLHSLGLADVSQMSIEPSPNAKLNGKLEPALIEYEFDQFSFNSDPAGQVLVPPTADVASDDPEARALFAAQAKSPSPQLAALLKDKSVLVRLNATTAYAGFKDPSVETDLISNTVDLDPAVASAALTALMAEGSDVAKSVVLRSVSVSLSEFTKMTAARLLADTKDAKQADNVARLLASRSWQAHVSAIESLAEIHTPESQIWRLAFIGMSDPAVKLAVTRYADPSLDKVAAPLLWSAVNEPSDRVRAESYTKLIQSSVESNRSEGYKGVRDDSEFVRRLVVEYLSSHPDEAHRGALRIAIADRSAGVRAAALLGFSTLDKGAVQDEIANVLDDPSPAVQLALIGFAKKHSFKLPQKSIDAMAASPDVRVSTAVKALGS